MRFALLGIVFMGMLPTLAWAQKAPPDLSVLVTEPGAYAVPVEAFKLGKVKGKIFGGAAISAGDYAFDFGTSVTQTNKGGPIAINLPGYSSHKSYRTVIVEYRVSKLGGPQTGKGKCTLDLKNAASLLVKTASNLYTCNFEALSPTSYALEAVVPSIMPPGPGISIVGAEEENFKALKARLRYNDVAYEAVPTGFAFERKEINRRVATGYTITQDGKLMGRIDFPDTRGGITDFAGSFDRKSVITAPTAESDGRQAVIFFAAQLFALPEANSPTLREN